jgi:D-alanyl-D-alanine carboxypeptidase
MIETEKLLQATLDKTVDNTKVFGTSFALKKESFVWSGSSGNVSKEQQYFIASTTKLFTTAIILKLKADSKLDLEDKIGNYVDKTILTGLHVYKGKEYSTELTVKQFTCSYLRTS